jgi:hypothetical protein
LVLALWLFNLKLEPHSSLRMNRIFHLNVLNEIYLIIQNSLKLNKKCLHLSKSDEEKKSNLDKTRTGTGTI